MKRHDIQLALSPGVRTNFTCDDLLFSMLPNEKRGDAQKYIRTAIVDLHQSVFTHMRLTFGEYVADLCEKYQTKPASVISTAVAWHTGKHSPEHITWTGKNAEKLLQKVKSKINHLQGSKP